MNDPGVAPLINHSKIIRVMKFIFYLISQHMYQSESASVICVRISTVSGNVGDLLCLVSLLIKNVGVILSFDKNKTELDRWLLVWYNKQQPLFWLLWFRVSATSVFEFLFKILYIWCVCVCVCFMWYCAVSVCKQKVCLYLSPFVHECVCCVYTNVHACI